MKKIMLALVVVGNMLLANVGIVKTITGTVEVKRAKKVLLLKKGST